MAEVGSIEVRIAARTRELADGINESNRKLRELGDEATNLRRRMETLGRSMSSVGAELSKAISLPLAALGGTALKTSIDFESAFAGVRKTVDATEEELADLRDGILEMSKRIPAAQTTIAGVAEAAGQLGIQVPNILAFTETMVNLGVATNLTAQDAATALARFANIVQMPQESFDRLGSTVVALGNNLATTEAEIVAMGLRIAGAGAQVGLAEAEILGLAGALSSVGIAAEAGGTAISRVMIEIATAVGQGGEDLEGFARVAGMSADEFARSWGEDAAGTLIRFVEGLGRIGGSVNVLEALGDADFFGGEFAEALEDLGIEESLFGVLQDLGLSEIRVRDALLRMSGAGDVLRNSIELGREAWEENTALVREAEQRYQTTASQLDILLNKLKDVSITLGDSLTPILLQLIDAAEPFINMLKSAAEWFADLDPQMQTAIVTFGALAAAIGPVALALGTIVAGLGVLAGPAGWAALAAVGAAVGVAFGPQILESLGEFEGFGKAIQTVKETMEPLKELLDTVLAVALDIGKAFIPIFEISWDAFSTALNAALLVVKGTLEIIVGILQGNLPDALGGVETVLAGFEAAIKGVLNIIIDIVNLVIRALNTISIKIPDWVPLLGGKEFGINIPEIQRLELQKGTLLPGTGGPDSIPALLAPGEAITPYSVWSRGPEALVAWFRAMGAPGYQRGGIVPPTSFPPVPMEDVYRANFERMDHPAILGRYVRSLLETGAIDEEVQGEARSFSSGLAWIQFTPWGRQGIGFPLEDVGFPAFGERVVMTVRAFLAGLWDLVRPPKSDAQGFLREMARRGYALAEMEPERLYPIPPGTAALRDLIYNHPFNELMRQIKEAREHAAQAINAQLAAGVSVQELLQEFTASEILLAGLKAGNRAPDYLANQLYAAYVHGLFPRPEDIIENLPGLAEGQYDPELNVIRYRTATPLPSVVAHEEQHRAQWAWIGEVADALHDWDRGRLVLEGANKIEYYRYSFAESEAFELMDWVEELLRLLPTVEDLIAERFGVDVLSSLKRARQIEFQGLQRGGILPGYGGGDRRPFLLEDGEAVIPKESVAANLPLVRSLIGMQTGGIVGGARGTGVVRDLDDAAVAVTAVLNQLASRLSEFDRGLGDIVRALRWNAQQGRLQFDVASLITSAISFGFETLMNVISTNARIEQRIAAVPDPGTDILGVAQVFANFRNLNQNIAEREQRLRDLQRQQQAVNTGTAVGAAIGAGIGALFGPFGILAGFLIGGAAGRKVATDTIGPEIAATEEQIQALEAQIRNARVNLINALRIAADDFARGIAGAFEAADVDEFGERLGQSVRDQIRQAMIQVFIAQVLEPQITELAQMVQASFLDGVALDMEFVNARIEGIAEISRELYDRFDQLGLTVEKTDQALRSMSRNIPTGYVVAQPAYQTARASGTALPGPSTAVDAVSGVPQSVTIQVPVTVNGPMMGTSEREVRRWVQEAAAEALEYAGIGVTGLRIQFARG